MFTIKTLEELEQSIEMLLQETDASQKTKSKHLLKRQFKLALDRIESLETYNKQLRSELEKSPEYQQQQSLKMIQSMFKHL